MTMKRMKRMKIECQSMKSLKTVRKTIKTAKVRNMYVLTDFQSAFMKANVLKDECFSEN